jgi:hypothetical protein
MNPTEKKTIDTENESTSIIKDDKTAGKEEAVPILELTVVSKNGCTPSDVVGSLKIPMEDSANLELCSSSAGSEPFVNIVKDAKLPTKPQWRVLAGLSNDHLLKAMMIKEKVCQKYVCINALLSFYKETGEHLLSEDIIPGEWLLPIKVKKEGAEISANRTSCVVLAYVRVKIGDENDTPPTGKKPATSKSTSDTQDTSKKV